MLLCATKDAEVVEYTLSRAVSPAARRRGSGTAGDAPAQAAAAVDSVWFDGFETPLVFRPDDG
ncbi:MAG: hypothetical protein U0746_19495 [Gemmataceae bacterium]